jgi:nucleotide-binding universal stress UspA family protein
MNSPIVVGFDGSPASERAIDLAAVEAASRNLPLRVVHGFAWPYMHVAGAPFGPGAGDAALRMQAENTLAAGRERATEQLAKNGASTTDVTSAVIVGFPAATLITESRHATAVVVGNRGLGGFAGLLLGSVASQLVAHSRRPVIIARGRPDPTGDIVVGVDGSGAADPAITFAFDEALHRGCPVRPVLVWSHPIARGPGDMLPLVFDAELLERQSANVLDAAIAEARAAHPMVPVREQLVYGRTRRTLIDQSRDAALVVVGRTGHSSVNDWMLGTVSSALLHHADCPVAVVPAARR